MSGPGTGAGAGVTSRASALVSRQHPHHARQPAARQTTRDASPGLRMWLLSGGPGGRGGGDCDRHCGRVHAPRAHPSKRTRARRQAFSRHDGPWRRERTNRCCTPCVRPRARRTASVPAEAAGWHDPKASAWASARGQQAHPWTTRPQPDASIRSERGWCFPWAAYKRVIGCFSRVLQKRRCSVDRAAQYTHADAPDTRLRTGKSYKQKAGTQAVEGRRI